MAYFFKECFEKIIAALSPKTQNSTKKALYHCILGRTYGCLLSLNTKGIISPRTGRVKGGLSGKMIFFT
jgi:hypothetical protein